VQHCSWAFILLLNVFLIYSVMFSESFTHVSMVKVYLNIISAATMSVVSYIATHPVVYITMHWCYMYNVGCILSSGSPLSPRKLHITKHFKSYYISSIYTTTWLDCHQHKGFALLMVTTFLLNVALQFEMILIWNELDQVEAV